MTSALLPAVLAAGALACVLGLPRGAGLRLGDVVAPPPVPGAVPLAARRPPASLLGLAGVAAVLVLVVQVGPVPALLAGAGTAAGLRAARSRHARGQRGDERARAVEACAALASELRAGRAPADALAAAAELAAGPCRVALTAAAGSARLGGDTAAALRPPERCAVPDVLRSLAACWTVCAGSGTGLAAAVERLEEGLRADLAQRRAVEAELAGPRATAALLAVLPAAGLLLAAGLGADPLHVLLSTPVGLVCLTLGLLLDALGVWWTGQIVARAAAVR